MVSGSDPKNKLVLIIEDDEAFMDLMEFSVTREGFRVERAADGELGLWKAQHHSPDLILLDLMLPKFGGFDILKELQHENTIGIPIVIMTGAASEFDKAEALKMEPNVRDFLRKPVDHGELAVLLHSILG